MEEIEMKIEKINGKDRAFCTDRIAQDAHYWTYCF